MISRACKRGHSVLTLDQENHLPFFDASDVRNFQDGACEKTSKGTSHCDTILDFNQDPYAGRLH